MFGKYKQEIIVGAFFVAFVVAFAYLYGFLLPFILGLVMAFAVAPIIKRMQRKLKSWNLSASIFLIVVSLILVGVIFFLAAYINRDFKRLNESFHVLVDKNQDKLDATAEKVKEYAQGFFDIEKIEEELKLKADSISQQAEEELNQLDTESISASIEQLISKFESSTAASERSRPTFSSTVILLSTLMYFVLILFNFDYFNGLRKRYFKGYAKSRISLMMDDFNNSFILYFKLRTKIVVVLSFLYLITFIILDMPGTMLFTLLILFLSYIPYLQYLSLIPLALGCLVLSIENENHFLIYFGIVVGVFAIASLLEELILTPRIMEANIGMNPVIMVLALSIWSYLLGLPGLLIGVPLTSLIIIYIKRYFLTAYESVSESGP